MTYTHHPHWGFIVSLQRWLNPSYGMTNEGSMWCQLLLFQFGICPHGISALSSGFTLGTAHFVYAFVYGMCADYWLSICVYTRFLHSSSTDFWIGCFLEGLLGTGSFRAAVCTTGLLAGLHPTRCQQPLPPFVAIQTVQAPPSIPGGQKGTKLLPVENHWFR